MLAAQYVEQKLDANPFHVLLLEDGDKTSSLIALALKKRLQCRVTIARSHLDVSKTIEADPPDLFMLDLYADDEKSLDVCESFKKLDAMKDVPVVFFSDEGNAMLRAAAIRAGGVENIKKPFFPNELITRVRAHIEMRDSRETIMRQLNEQRALLRVLCHDLLNPVAAVDSLLSMVEDCDDGTKQVLDIARESNAEALKLIEHVRSYWVQADSGKTYQRDCIDLKEAVDASLTIVSAKADAKEISLLVDLEEGAQIFINRVLLVHNILNNLITNSIKFSHRGSSIRVVAKNVEIDETMYAQIKIEDEGVGIPLEALQVIFEPRQSNSRSGTENEEGTGFGMPLIKHYVEQSYGSLYIESYPEGSEDAPWTGTRIEMRFPHS